MAAAGEMSETVSFLARTRVRRADGGWDASDAAPVEVWASVTPTAAGEKNDAGRLAGVVAYDVHVYRDDAPTGLSTDYTLTWHAEGGDVPLNIKGIDWPRGRELFVHMTCEKGAVL